MYALADVAIRFRRLSQKDADWLRSFMQAHYPPAYDYLWTDAGLDYIAKTYSREALTQEFADPAGRAYQILVDGCAEGFCRLVDQQRSPDAAAVTPACYLQRLYLSSACQGRGLGEQILARLIEDARARGWAALWLETMQVGRARHFYERAGFQMIGRKTLVAAKLRQGMAAMEVRQLLLDPGTGAEKRLN